MDLPLRIIFYSAVGILILSTVFAILYDFVEDRKEENIPNTSKSKPSNLLATFDFRKRKSLLQWITLVLGFTGMLAFYGYCLSQAGIAKLPFLVHQIFIIFTTLAVSSALFGHFTDKKMNVVGRMHIAIALVGIACVVATGWFENESLKIAVDIVAHTITLSLSIIALFGDTFENSKLTETGEAVLVVVVIFFGISIFSSMDSKLQSQQDTEDLKTRYDSLTTVMDALLEKSIKLITAIDTVRGISRHIKTNVGHFEGVIHNELNSQFTKNLHSHFGDGRKARGRLYTKIDSLKIHETNTYNVVEAYTKSVDNFRAESTALAGSALSLNNKLTEYETSRKSYDNEILTTRKLQDDLNKELKGAISYREEQEKKWQEQHKKAEALRLKLQQYLNSKIAIDSALRADIQSLMAEN